MSEILLANAGKLRVAGLDFDGRVAFSDRLTFIFGGNLSSTKMRELTARAPIAAYLTNKEIPFDLVAKATFTLGAQYRVPMGDGHGVQARPEDCILVIEAASEGSCQSHSLLELVARRTVMLNSSSLSLSGNARLILRYHEQCRYHRFPLDRAVEIATRSASFGTRCADADFRILFRSSLAMNLLSYFNVRKICWLSII